MNQLDCPFTRNKLNIVAAMCAPNRNYAVIQELLNHLSGYSLSAVLFVTSRRSTVKQNSVQQSSEDQLAAHFVTYAKLIRMIWHIDPELPKHPIVVLDECHVLVTEQYVKNMEVVPMWIAEALKQAGTYIIGITATPGIIWDAQPGWELPIQQINTGVVSIHRAKQLTCTHYKTVPYLVNHRLTGKTLIMCALEKSCYDLADQIPNSAVLVGMNNHSRTAEMKPIRTAIRRRNTIPDTYTEVLSRDECGNTLESEPRPLNVLICTTTIASGYAFNQESGIRNVVSTVSDPVHINQLCARFDYELDNLIISDERIRSDNYNPNAYLTKQRRAFKQYLESDGYLSWFVSIAHLINGNERDTIKYSQPANEQRFIDYLKEKWVVPGNCDDPSKYMIHTSTDKDEIRSMYIQCNLTSKPRYTTFAHVVKEIDGALGFMVSDGRKRFSGRVCRYKLIKDRKQEEVNE